MIIYQLAILVCTSPSDLLNIDPGSSDNMQVISLGDCLYSNGALSLDDGSHLGRLGVKPIVTLRGLPPMVARTVRCMASRRLFHFSVAEPLWGTELSPQNPRKLYNEVCCDFNTGVPCFLVWWYIFGWVLILQHTKEWSVSQSAVWQARVCSTFLKSVRTPV